MLFWILDFGYNLLVINIALPNLLVNIKYYILVYCLIFVYSAHHSSDFSVNNYNCHFFIRYVDVFYGINL